MSDAVGSLISLGKHILILSWLSNFSWVFCANFGQYFELDGFCLCGGSVDPHHAIQAMSSSQRHLVILLNGFVTKSTFDGVVDKCLPKNAYLRTKFSGTYISL